MVLPIILSPDGNRLAIASCNKLKIFHIWKTSKGRLEFVLTNPSSGNLTSIVFSPDGSRIAAGSADATVSIWNLMKGKLETSLKGHSQCVNMVNFSPDGSRIVSAADDIRIWNSRTHHLELVLKGYSGSVKSLVFSPEGTYIMSAHTDMKIRIWDTATGELKDNLQGVHGAPVTHVAFSIDGSRMISISDDQRVSIWRFTATGPSRTVLAGYLDQANSVLFSPDGTRVISGSDDHKVRIWRTDMEATPEFDVVLLGHHERVNYIEFSPDGSRFLSASEDQTIRIWNASTGNLEGVLKESADVKQARFSPDGSRIVSIKRIWNPATGEYIVREGFGSVIFSDGHQLPPLPPLDHKVPRGVGGRVYRGFHEMPISPKEAPNLGIISRNRRWILYPGGGRRCWLPGPYRSFTALASHNSKICLGFETGMLLLLEMFNVIISLKMQGGKMLTLNYLYSSLHTTRHRYLPEVAERELNHKSSSRREIGSPLTTEH
jgi:WD40 repeat protein